MATKTRIPEIIRNHEQEILDNWVQEQLATAPKQRSLIKPEVLKEQCREFLQLITTALQTDDAMEFSAKQWGPARDFLTQLSRSRGQQGFTPSETATFVLSLKRPIFTRVRKTVKEADELADEVWLVTRLLDDMGLLTTEAHQKAREEVISRQQQEMMELSTPVVKLWDGVLALPLIGTLDSARTQVVMEALLDKIVATGSNIAIIDITGVPTVDTLVAQHLLKTVTAARLMGAECIISGIRPQIAQTIVHLGVTLHNVTTKSNLADAFQLALQKAGLTLVHVTPRVAERA